MSLPNCLNVVQNTYEDGVLLVCQNAYGRTWFKLKEGQNAIDANEVLQRWRYCNSHQDSQKWKALEDIKQGTRVKNIHRGRRS